MSKIEWCDQTWNPIVGCLVVSPGCTNCYAMRMAARLERMGVAHYTGLTQATKAGAVWTGKVALAPESVFMKPLGWRSARRVFVNSMGDLFHEAVPDEWIDRVFAVMALAWRHQFLVLTKRSARMRDYVSRGDNEHSSLIESIADRGARLVEDGDTAFDHLSSMPWPLPNVWLGVSAEDQARADERIPYLLATPAAVRFVSAEPLLAPVDLGAWLRDGSPRLDWVIVGGESGPGARPMHADWARAIRDQCVTAGVPFFFKQWGEWLPTDHDAGAISYGAHRRHGWDIDGPHEAWSYRVGKTRAGRLLDGREWNEFPEVAA
jgi:protein gp37